MRKLAIVAVLGLLSSAAVAEEPAWLSEARAREAAPRGFKKIQSKDEFFSARVPAKLARAITSDEAGYSVALEAKAGAPIECIVLREDQDLATFLVAATASSYEVIASAYGKLAAKSVERVDAGAIGGSPFLAVEWMHRLEKEGSPAAVGGLKQIAASKGGHAIYCVHDEVGYAETFRRVAGALIESVQFADAPASRPYRTEISTMSLKGMRVAVDQVTYLRDADGDTRIDHMTALLIPVDAQTLSAQDELEVQWARPDGSLINALSVASINGEIETKLKLDPLKDGSWEVSGKFKTKPVQAKLPKSEPSSILGDTLLLQAKLAEPNPVGGAIRVRTWLPGLDPATLVEQKLAIQRALDGDRFAAQLTAAGLTADLVVDRAGTTLSGRIKMGPTRLDVEQVYADGVLTEALPASPAP